MVAVSHLYEASPRTLIDDLLAEQQELTAVERFARQHARHTGPAQARYYRELIPLAKPAPGQQYAFGVDLDACTGCKACVSACHSLNGLDEDEVWRNVGSIHGGTEDSPYQQTVTTACHHCVEPGCLLGCPVAAYEKDPETGIVRHLDDQCIGCEYCSLKCPYDVPKYSKRRGIVRKCDMCYQRLAVGEAPACVQACPNEAITIRLVDVAQVRAEAQPGVRLLPGAFDSSYTRPTTTYTTSKSIPANAHPGDVYRLRLEHPHWPLIWMLLLSQASAGLQCALALATALPAVYFSRFAPPLACAAFAFLQAGLILSVFHLGKPLKAWRFFLGLRTSWMSREIVAFSAFAGASAVTALSSLCYLPESASTLAWLAFHVPGLAPWLAKVSPAWLASLTPGLAFVSAFMALASIFCSAMIYVDTRRPFWSRSVTFPKFFGVMLILGLSGCAALLSWNALLDASLLWPARAVCAGSLYGGLLYAAWEGLFFFHSLRDSSAPAHRSAQTIWHLLRSALALRAMLIVLSACAGAGAVLSSGLMQVVAATAAFILTFGSSVVERYCFFTASAAPRMPGGIAS